MFRNRIVFSLASLAICSVMASAASASTLYLTDVSPSADMTVTFPTLDAQTTPYVGQIHWNFDRNNPGNATLDTLVQGSSLTTFCIEGTQDVYLQQYATFGTILTDISTAPHDNVGSAYVMGTNATVLSKFWDLHYGDSMLSNANAAAFQLGIWEIVYDGEGSLNLNGDSFTASAVAGNSTSAAAFAQAQSWLSGLASATATDHYQLYVLSDPGLQDQLFGVAKAVPLPAALPAGLSALLGLALMRRLRRAY